MLTTTATTTLQDLRDATHFTTIMAEVFPEHAARWDVIGTTLAHAITHAQNVAFLHALAPTLLDPDERTTT